MFTRLVGLGKGKILENLQKHVSTTPIVWRQFEIFDDMGVEAWKQGLFTWGRTRSPGINRIICWYNTWSEPTTETTKFYVRPRPSCSVTYTKVHSRWCWGVFQNSVLVRRLWCFSCTHTEEHIMFHEFSHDSCSCMYTDIHCYDRRSGISSTTRFQKTSQSEFCILWQTSVFIFRLSLALNLDSSLPLNLLYFHTPFLLFMTEG